MNPLQQTEREISAGGLSRLIPAVSVLIILCAVVLSWTLVKPAGDGGNGLWVMLLWFLIIAIAAGALLFWGTARRLNRAALKGVAVLVVILGTLTAFLSGDKFDAVRAAMVSIVLMVMSYGRHKR